MNSRVITFMILALNAFLTIFLAGYDTQIAAWFYVIKFFVAMTFRYRDYKPQGWHYFMTEFCYFANSLLVVYIIANQLFGFRSKMAFWTLFVMSNSALPMGALTLGDKLVFHDIEKIISLMIHLSPAILTWSIRWHQPDLFPDAHSGAQELSFTNVIYDSVFGTCLALIPYTIWMIFYYLFVFCFQWKKIKEEKLMTVYTYFIAQKDHPLNKLIGWIPEGHVKHIVYMCLHCISIIPAYLLTGLWWNSYYLHTGLIFGLSLASIYFAATYYDTKLLKEKIQRPPED